MSIFEKFVKVIQPWIFAARYPHLKVEIEPGTRALFDELRGTSAVVCPNHSRHEDGELLFLISILIKQQFKFLAAREMFDSYFGLGGVILRQLGCFEVDRGGGDNTDVIRATEHQLTAEGAKVVIFPEGEIGYDNDRLGALEPGAAAIGLDAYIRFQHHHQERQVCIVPLALSYEFVEPEKVCAQLLERLESKLRLPPITVSLYERARRVSEVYLETKEKQFGISAHSNGSLEADDAPVNEDAHVRGDGPAREEARVRDDGQVSHFAYPAAIAPANDTIDDRVARVFSASLQEIADAIDYKIPKGSEKHRLHHLQSRIFVKRTKAGFLQKAKFDRMDKQTILLNRLRCISSNEFDGSASINSLANLLCSLDVLITGRAQPDAPQVVIASAAEPISMSEYAHEWRLNRESAIERIIEELRGRLLERLKKMRQRQPSDCGGSNLTLRKSM
ncbi:MAG TPA: 1-acyl-sn-glycerol-3-phosphate acyltransferase [Drouetiella sp.]|jgi:Acyltransferase